MASGANSGSVTTPRRRLEHKVHDNGFTRSGSETDLLKSWLTCLFAKQRFQLFCGLPFIARQVRRFSDDRQSLSGRSRDQECWRAWDNFFQILPRFARMPRLTRIPLRNRFLKSRSRFHLHGLSPTLQVYLRHSFTHCHFCFRFLLCPHSLSTHLQREHQSSFHTRSTTIREAHPARQISTRCVFFWLSCPSGSGHWLSL